MPKNKSTISFGAIILATLLLLVYLSNRFWFKNNYETNIEKFEENYQPVLEQLTDTLKKIKDLDTNYMLQILPKFDNEQNYYYLDQDHKIGNYFTVPYFKLTEIQVNFLKDAGTDIRYIKKEKAFYLKPFYFKEGKETLLLVIAKDSTSIPQLSQELYAKRGRYFYYITNAW